MRVVISPPRVSPERPWRKSPYLTAHRAHDHVGHVGVQNVPRVLPGCYESFSMDILKATQEAAQGKVRLVYVLGGEEQVLLRRCLDAIRKATVGGGVRGLAEDVFDGPKVTAQTVTEACRTLPMMSRWRLVTVRDANELPAPEVDGLVGYFKHPSPSTVLLLVLSQVDARRKLVMEAKKQGLLVVAERISEAALPGWIEREARAVGAELGPGVVESLALAIGPDLGLLGDALERLKLYAHGRTVTTRDVDLVVTSVREVPAWDLAHAVVARNRGAALSVLHQLLGRGQEALPTLGLLAWQVRQLARAQQLLAMNPDANLAQELRIFDGADRVKANLRRWPPTAMARALRVLAATDAALKGSRRGDQRVLEECVLALCGAAGMGEAALRA
ncbi:MAG: DNA polymerase III subunit delta [Deltaproteobacteria bacterium]|nr:DNA polymerase III subunit delta [Deltaproteobacteria bacterium]